MNLSLNDAVKTEVSSDSYKQYLKEDGRRILLQVPNFYREDHLKILINNNVTAVLVPLDSVTKAKLQVIENFVKANVVSEKYKPLYLHDAMYVNLSKWCTYELMKPDGSRQPLPVDKFLGKGTYSLEIQASHVYVGPHRGGETFSISLHIVRLAYQPDPSLSDVIDDIVQSMQTPPNPPAPAATAPVTKPKLKRVRRRHAFDEVDGQKCAAS